MNDVVVNVVGMLPLKRQLELIKMPASQRKRMMYRIGKRVERDSKRRIRQQRDLAGRAFTPRSSQSKKRTKMLRKLGKELKTYTRSSTEAVVGFKRQSSARIAAKHQYGHEEIVRANKQPASSAFYDKPATRKQAKALRDAGFKIKKAKGRGTKAPTLRWITENLTIGQAGYVLRALREWAGDLPLDSWKTVLPARSFLGATAQDIADYTDDIFKQMKQEFAS
jgi:phage virion morphogenesis protein